MDFDVPPRPTAYWYPLLTASFNLHLRMYLLFSTSAFFLSSWESGMMRSASEFCLIWDTSKWLQFCKLPDAGVSSCHSRPSTQILVGGGSGPAYRMRGIMKNYWRRSWGLLWSGPQYYISIDCLVGLKESHSFHPNSGGTFLEVSETMASAWPSIWNGCLPKYVPKGFDSTSREVCTINGGDGAAAASFEHTVRAHSRPTMDWQWQAQIIWQNDRCYHSLTPTFICSLKPVGAAWTNIAWTSTSDLDLRACRPAYSWIDHCWKSKSTFCKNNTDFRQEPYARSIYNTWAHWTLHDMKKCTLYLSRATIHFAWSVCVRQNIQKWYCCSHGVYQSLCCTIWMFDTIVHGLMITPNQSEQGQAIQIRGASHSLTWPTHRSRYTPIRWCHLPP
jgi:hypothetical protein